MCEASILIYWYAPLYRDVRTVTVWFQNRRQIAKKSPDMNVSAPSSVPPRATPHRSTTGSRPPLVIVSHRNLPNGSKTSASVTTMPLYPAPVTIIPVGYPFSHPPIQSTQPNQPVQPQDLWKFIPSSPPTSQRDTSISPTTPSTIQASPSVEEEQVPIGKRKRALEWACHRLEKRQRLGKDAHPEEDSGDTTDDESQSDHTQTTCYDPLGLAIQDCKSMEMVERRAYEIPAQYHATFPPDVVLGASLLLTLKHSG